MIVDFNNSTCTDNNGNLASKQNAKYYEEPSMCDSDTTYDHFHTTFVTHVSSPPGVITNLGKVSRGPNYIRKCLQTNLIKEFVVCPRPAQVSKSGLKWYVQDVLLWKKPSFEMVLGNLWSYTKNTKESLSRAYHFFPRLST